MEHLVRSDDRDLRGLLTLTLVMSQEGKQSLVYT